MTLGLLTQSGVNLDVSKIWNKLGNQEHAEWLFREQPLFKLLCSMFKQNLGLDKEKPREEARTNLTIIKVLHFS